MPKTRHSARISARVSLPEAEEHEATASTSASTSNSTAAGPTGAAFGAGGKRASASAAVAQAGGGGKRRKRDKDIAGAGSAGASTGAGASGSNGTGKVRVKQEEGIPVASTSSSAFPSASTSRVAAPDPDESDLTQLESDSASSSDEQEEAVAKPVKKKKKGKGKAKEKKEKRSKDKKGKGKARAEDEGDADLLTQTSAPPQHPLSSPSLIAASLLPPKKPPPPPDPVDHLTPLSSELLALILSFLVVPSPVPTSASSPSMSASPPTPYPLPDRPALCALALTCKAMVAHARAVLYRDLKVETRVQAHAVHRTLHGSETARSVRSVEANVEMMAKTSSQWLGWFLFHSMHSLCGIIGSCRYLLTLTLYLPSDSSAWTGSLCQSFVDLKHLHTLIKDLEPSLSTSFSPPLLPGTYSSTSTNGGNKWSDYRGGGAGKSEGMDVGWRPRKSVSMWAVSQLIKPLSTLRSLTTLRLCGISSDSSTLPAPPPHALKLVEVVLIEVNITNTDLLQLLGDAKNLQRFTLWRSSLLSKRGLTHVLKKCPKLVELRVGGSWFGAKEEDDKNFPLDDSLPFLPSLRHLFVSGSLISPASLELPSLNLQHLFVTNAPSWTPAAVHSGLVKMPYDARGGGGAGVKRLTLPEMRDPSQSSNQNGANSHPNAAAAQPQPQPVGGGATGSGEQWNETWRFTVRKTGEAKGVRVDDRWRPGREEREERERREREMVLRRVGDRGNGGGGREVVVVEGEEEGDESE
ncbi:hypothetical protein JCM8547_000088 [Rhodosporidiobolus lusitaniae]